MRWLGIRDNWVPHSEVVLHNWLSQCVCDSFAACQWSFGRYNNLDLVTSAQILSVVISVPIANSCPRAKWKKSLEHQGKTVVVCYVERLDQSHKQKQNDELGTCFKISHFENLVYIVFFLQQALSEQTKQSLFTRSALSTCWGILLNASFYRPVYTVEIFQVFYLLHKHRQTNIPFFSLLFWNSLSKLDVSNTFPASMVRSNMYFLTLVDIYLPVCSAWQRRLAGGWGLKTG